MKPISWLIKPISWLIKPISWLIKPITKASQKTECQFITSPANT